MAAIFCVHRSSLATEFGQRPSVQWEEAVQLDYNRTAGSTKMTNVLPVRHLGLDFVHLELLQKKRTGN
ncbi:hypothetical protein PM082_003553 [Marasmius tenuissimus]|nr:hypothetical protein PM082_003553 [Marasmius tenuissimus]